MGTPEAAAKVFTAAMSCIVAPLTFIKQKSNCRVKEYFVFDCSRKWHRTHWVNERG